MLLVADGQHVSEAALIYDCDGGVMAQCAAKLVDVAVERVAIAWLVTLPHGNHQFRCINSFPNVAYQSFKDFCFEV